MTDPSQRPFPKEHPLRWDRARLDDITDLMWWEILKVLHQSPRARPKPGRQAAAELTLVGGLSAIDVLQEALVGLLRHSPKDDVNWEGLGVRIAQNKAKEALRKSRAYRTRGDGVPDIQIGSLDAEDDEGDRLVDGMADEEPSLRLEEAEEEVLLLRRQQAFHRAANEILTDRDRQIVLRIMRGETRDTIKDDFSLTRQRIGQIHREALVRIRRELDDDPLFRPPHEPTEGGTPNDE